MAALGRLAEASWAEFTARLGVTTAEFTVMATLADARHGLMQRELASRAGVDPRNMVATVKRLTDRGWVQATAHPGDGRAKLVTCTDQGRTDWAGVTGDLVRQRTAFFDALTG